MTEEHEQRLSRIERQLELLETYSVQAFWMALDRAYESVLRDRELACIVCGRRGVRSHFGIRTEQCIFGGGRLERYQCPACDAVFGPQKYLDLSEDFVQRDYALLYARYKETDSLADELRTFYSLEPKRGGVYLNWGCGIWSETIPRLRAEGFDVWGFDPTAHDSRPHVVNHRDQISTRFDGIFSNNVIEHLREPVTQFEEFHRMLKPGAVMAHSSPCYEYAYAVTRFHTLFPIGRSADVLAARTRFRVKTRTQAGEYINMVFEAV
jgi:SAM-dependent methyltransferase